jgi:hypothetical protein
MIIFALGKNKLLTTRELEKYIIDLYLNVKSYAENDGVYMPLQVLFENTTKPKGFISAFAHADKEGYHYTVIGDHGELHKYPITRDLFEFTYQVLNIYIFQMAVNYERANRLDDQDSRRIMFAKELQYWSLLGEDFAERGKQRIDEVLRKYPYSDT